LNLDVHGLHQQLTKTAGSQPSIIEPGEKITIQLYAYCQVARPSQWLWYYITTLLWHFINCQGAAAANLRWL